MAIPTLQALSFEKYEGIGNDFIVVEADTEHDVSPELAAKLCDRRFGIGADGVLLVLPPRDPAHLARMRVLNADGSVPEMCGNGMRCVALHVVRHRSRRAAVREDVYETDAGPKLCRVEIAGDGRSADVTVDMGPARVLGERRIALSGAPRSEWAEVDLVEVDMGNPHAVLLRRPNPSDIDRIGPALATHPAFPQGANIGFARVENRHFMDLVVWERGVGLTLACGTGACAAAAAACFKDLAAWDERVSVKLPGGRLTIWFEGPERLARMRGPARHVYSGVIVPDEEASSA